MYMKWISRIFYWLKSARSEMKKKKKHIIALIKSCEYEDWKNNEQTKPCFDIQRRRESEDIQVLINTDDL